MRRLLEESRLLPAGTHTGLDVLEGRLDEELDYNLAIGNRWIDLPRAAGERAGATWPAGGRWPPP